jgi:hypothetical protein
MRSTSLAICVASAALAGCGQSGDSGKKAAAPKKEKAPYCFFKDSETKAWTATRAKDGNITVKGKAYRSDPRYKAVLGEAKVSGSSAELRPGITVNDTGFAADGNWWDVTTTIPNSAALTTVDVRCGKKTLAHFDLPSK